MQIHSILKATKYILRMQKACIFSHSLNESWKSHYIASYALSSKKTKQIQTQHAWIRDKLPIYLLSQAAREEVYDHYAEHQDFFGLIYFFYLAVRLEMKDLFFFSLGLDFLPTMTKEL